MVFCDFGNWMMALYRVVMKKRKQEGVVVL